MRPKLVYAFSVLALLAGVSLALGGGILSEYGPLPSSTGAPVVRSKPAEWDCTLCHASETGNLNTPGGRIEILDLPKIYSAGQTYRIRVRITTDSTAAYPDRDWGFQLTAVRASDGEGCGAFLLDDPDSLQVLTGETPDLASRHYVEQTTLGDRDRIASPVEWTFSWKAPDTPADTALFFCAGNASNGSMDPTGDFVFTTADTVLDITTPVRPVSWGEVKRRYR